MPNLPVIPKERCEKCGVEVELKSANHRTTSVPFDGGKQLWVVHLCASCFDELSNAGDLRRFAELAFQMKYLPSRR